MNTHKESRRIGGLEAIKGSVIIFILFELVFLYYQTKGDFANGILFFIEEQVNVMFLIVWILYFVMMYLLGRQAGKSILIKNKPYYSVGLVCGFIFTLTIIVCNLMAILVSSSHHCFFNNNEIVMILFRNFFIFLVPMLLVWLWIGYQIKGTDIFS